MEYGFRIADLFPESISIVGSDLIPLGCPGLNKLGSQTVKTCVAEILDTMGRASAAAQNLHHIITGAAKLRESNGEQQVYVYCDLQANVVIGLLKVGRKKLFVFDQGGTQHEMYPLCILDFYVHESRQRCGCGRQIFEYMLQHDGAEVRHLAIDHPSDKFLFFLRKYYNLTQIIPQVNNFVIFDGFFTARPDYAGKKKRWTGLDQIDSESAAERNKRNQRTQLEDSRNYNSQPGLFLRNPAAGSLPNYAPMQKRYDSSGGILQPPTAANTPFYRSANNITPNYQTNGVRGNAHQLHQQRLYSKPEGQLLYSPPVAKIERQNSSCNQHLHQPLW